jgi:hypothetical protein
MSANKASWVDDLRERSLRRLGNFARPDSISGLVGDRRDCVVPALTVLDAPFSAGTRSSGLDLYYLIQGLSPMLS